MGPQNIHAHTLSTWSPLNFPYLLTSFSGLFDGLSIVTNQKAFCLNIVLSRQKHKTSSVSDWENMGIHKLQFVDFSHSVVVWQLVVSTERSEVPSAVQLCSSCVLMRWILMNPSSTRSSLIPIQKGLVFKFIIESRLIRGLIQTVCHGIFTGKLVTFLVYFSIFMIFLQLAGWPFSLLSFAIRNYWSKCCRELMGETSRLHSATLSSCMQITRKVLCFLGEGQYEIWLGALAQ